MKMVMAHKLGHALLLNSKIEKEANLFAAELLIPDEILLENWTNTTKQLSRLLGCEHLFTFDLKNNILERNVTINTVYDLLDILKVIADGEQPSQGSC